MFGGKNANGLYVPLTEVEQEVIQRLVESDDLMVVIHGWGFVSSPRISFGDHRVKVEFELNFTSPPANTPVPVYYFDLELRTKSEGRTLFRQRQSCQYEGKPMQVAAGVFLGMVWDIALSHLDPALVKSVKPGATGMTSRVLDKDTGKATLTGNMRLSEKEIRTLAGLRDRERMMREDNLRKARGATDRESRDIKDGKLRRK
ncbi:MAG: hypothetical protein LAT68_15445 [Cyclobacteriaceae bacterium]|nr:hypothetical protein [Cyclobacteriaceae bacterium]